MKVFTRLFSILLLLTVFVFMPQGFSNATVLDSAKSDTQPPEVPKGLVITNKTHTSLSLSWSSSSDDTKVKGYQVYRDGKKIITTSKTNFTNTDLVPGRKYTYTIKAYDAAGNISPASTAIDAGTVPDCQAPSTPGNLTLSSPGFTSVTVSWSSSTDNTSIKGYVVYRNGTKAASTSATSYTVKGLLPGTTYSLFIKAYDIAGNYSSQSSSIPGTTLSDTTAPGRPSGLKTASVTETEITLMWSPSSDNVKVKSYEVYCNGEKTGTPTKPIYSGKTLIPGKSYKYTVKAIDTVGNKSESSDPITITTLKDTKKPSTPTGLKAGKVKGSSVPLEWNASSDNTKVDGYTIYCNGVELTNTKKTARTVKSTSGLGINIYWVRAVDLAGNLSDASNKITVITAL
jgi:chitodextrinase